MVSAKWQMILVFMASSALAVNTAPLYPTATQKSTSYQQAVSELQEAQSSLTRTQSDPIALKPELLGAKQRLDMAEASLVSQGLQVRQSLFADLQNLEVLQNQQETQSLSLQVAQLNAQAARAKFKAGAATQLDLNKAENDLEGAEKDLQAAKKQLQDAQERFKKRYGKTPDLTGDENIKWTSEALQKAMENHPKLLKDAAALENAELQYLIKSSDLSPSIEVQQAKTTLDNAKGTLAETRKELQEGLEDALNQHQSAVDALTAKEKALKLAQSSYSTQNSRFQKGLISKLQLLQAELEVKNAEGAVLQAKNNLGKAAYGVLVAANHFPWQEGQ